MKFFSIPTGTALLATAFFVSPNQAVSVYKPHDLADMIAAATPKLTPAQQTTAGRLLRGDNRRLQDLMDTLNSLVATLPADPRFDLTTDYLAALNYLKFNSYQPPPASFITVPTVKREVLPTITVPFTSLAIPDHDEYLPDFSEDELALFNFLFHQLPRRNTVEGPGYFEEGEDSLTTLHSRMFGVWMGGRQFHQYGSVDHHLDDRLRQIVFEDFAQHRIAMSASTDDRAYRNGDGSGAFAPYVVDLEFMSEFQVKSGHAKYGTAAFFQSNHDISHIFWNGKSYANPSLYTVPGNAQQFYSWEFVKRLFASSLQVDITVRDHLINSHLTAGNALVTATRTHFGKNNPLRRLLTPFTFGTASINKRASLTLVNLEGIFLRVSSFSGEGFEAYVARILTGSDFQFRSFPQQIASQNLDFQTNYEKDGMRFYEIVHRFVTNYIALHYPDGCTSGKQVQAWWVELENLRSTPNSVPWTAQGQDCATLADVIATYIVLVTAQHNHFGTSIVSALAHPCLAPSSILDPELLSLPNEYNCGSPSSAMYTLLLVSATQYETPKIVDDFTHMFEGLNVARNEQIQASKDLWTQMTAEMMALDADIAIENASRSIPFYSFMPSLVEAAVAV